MKQYLDLLNKLISEGIPSHDRTGTGTLSLFSENLKFDLEDGFPLVTTKFVNYKAVLAELLWFIDSNYNTGSLDSKIWDEWAYNGFIGPMYGAQWRNWEGIDQLEEVIENIILNPYSRRHVVSAWNTEFLPDEYISPQDNVKEGKMALAPCHHFFQFYARDDELSLHFSMRSTDVLI